MKKMTEVERYAREIADYIKPVVELIVERMGELKIVFDDHSATMAKLQDLITRFNVSADVSARSLNVERPPTDEDVERVAVAMCRAHTEEHNADPMTKPEAKYDMNTDEWWTSLEDEDREEYRRDARVAIHALRGPDRVQKEPKPAPARAARAGRASPVRRPLREDRPRPTSAPGNRCGAILNKDQIAGVRYMSRDDGLFNCLEPATVMKPVRCNSHKGIIKGHMGPPRKYVDV